VNQDALNDLLTSPGFFRFLGAETKLEPNDVKRIYLLGVPWGLWPPDLDVSHEAAEAEVSLFMYLAALQPLIDMDTVEKEAQLVAYEATLAGGDTLLPITAMTQVRAKVETAAGLSGSDRQTICRILHALYAYRQRVGRLCIQKVVETSQHKMEREQAASNAKAQSALVEQHRVFLEGIQRGESLL
jgi:hypothetical protein